MDLFCTKIQNTSFNTTHSACNLGFILDEHLTLSDPISALSKSCYSHIRQLRCIRPYLDLTTVSTIATSTVHSNLITATPSTSIFLSLRQTISSSSRILLLMLLLKPPHPVISQLYLNLYTNSKLTKKLTTSYSVLHTRFSQPLSPLTSIT